MLNLFMDSETRETITNIRIVGLVIALFCFCTWGTIREIRYALFGATTTAQVTEVLANSKGVHKVRITYDDPKATSPVRSEVETFESHAPLIAPPQAGQAIPIQYIPGSEGVARLPGTGQVLPIIGFCIFGGIAGFLLMLAHQAANVDPQERYRRMRQQQAAERSKDVKVRRRSKSMS